MSLPRPVRAVVFDMDGLLVDTETVYCEALTQACAEFGRELPTDVLHQMIGQVWINSAPLLVAHFGDDFDPEAMRARATEMFYEIVEAEVALKAGVLEILDELDRLRLPRAIATSSRRREVEHHIGGHGLLARFDAVLANGDYPRPKPNPDPYLAAAAALGLPPEDCLALEDSHNGVRAAASAGMMTIMVPDLLHPTDEMHALCVRIARDLHEVRELLAAQS
jgi:HAD superfamily hydrolase (TIGR01509 family)